MADLYDVLKTCVERTETYHRSNRRLGEQNTKVSLIEPVIGALGWDLFDPDEVCREYRRPTSSDNPVDYALLLLRTPRLFIEAKGLGENLDEARWANQTISYATAAGVEWVALTDGAEWRIFNAHAPVPIEDKLFHRVRLAVDVDRAFEILMLLSKDDMRDNRLQELWEAFFVDRQVAQVLNELFGSGEPARDLVNLVARRVPRLPRADVRSSLVRARANFDFPAPLPAHAASTATPQPTLASLGPASTGRAPVPPAPPPVTRLSSRVPNTRQIASRRSRVPVSPAERAVKLGDLLALGFLRPGPLFTHYRGQRYTAEVLSDGTIRYEGETYRTLSAAGAAVKEVVHGPDLPQSLRATDGWGFWMAMEADTGVPTSLLELRRRAAGGDSQPQR